MNFTREPIIETIVSPKDGYKLCIRNSKVSGSEEFFVDAVEVVSFGSSFFFRGLERPKPFLVPVSDYEIFEVKETRVILKNVSHDKNIKIGGGREASLKASKDQSSDKKEDNKTVEVASSESTTEPKPEKKRERRRGRRRRSSEEKKVEEETSTDSEEVQVEESTPAVEVPAPETSVDLETPLEPAAPAPSFSQMLPPPSVLISERLSQLRAQEIAEGFVSEDEPQSLASEEVISESVSIKDETFSECHSQDAENPSSPEATQSFSEENNDQEPAKVNTKEDDPFRF